jgi:hypothetical protein
MANRLFNQFQGTLEKSPVILWMRFTVGATGAPTLDTANSKGIKSITRNGVGNYTVVLQDSYQKLLGFNYFSVFSTPAAINAFVTTEAVATNSNPNVVFQFQSAAGTNVELANGEDIRMEFELKNSTAF